MSITMDNENLLMAFKALLQQQGYSNDTIRWYHNCTKNYFEWLNKKSLTPFKVTYKDLLDYIQLFKKKDYKVNTINARLTCLKMFYRSLLVADKESSNQEEVVKIIHLLEELKLRGGTRYVLHDLLSEEQLQLIYTTYPTETMVQIRNKCIIGMMIYQGLHAGDICRIRLGDLKLAQAKVFVAATRNSNERTLALQAPQIADLQKYLLGVRPGLLKYAAKDKSDYVFVSNTGKGGPGSIRGSLERFYKKLRNTHPYLKNTKQIRSSVIRHWLKKENIRLVQYKLGHRYLSSTQAYLEGDIESLQQQIDRLHPLNIPTDPSNS